MNKRCQRVLVALVMVWALAGAAFGGVVVYQTDFGLKDGAVSAMKGVALGVDSELKLYDLTHEIPPYNIWEGAYRLYQTVAYWPEGTVFVSVVDPGVGTERRSLVLRTKSGHIIVTPDNGTVTLVAESLGVAEVRQIDEQKHRLPGSDQSYTFFGRDLYSFVAAQLAGGKLRVEDVGPALDPAQLVKIAYQKAESREGALFGTIPVLDVEYGNVWTNIGKELFDAFQSKFGDEFDVVISKEGKEVFSGRIPYAETFGSVPEGKPLLYFNSLMNISLAINMDNFAEKNGVSSGPEWTVKVAPAAK
ncbi:MAG TPA: S-adenosyl-l-methionine hydroxide adenosyltransferase family protein [Synergistaceae bacterium]|nr:MAG: Adenosyl-chloride synthase [Synergistetes bacterium ADurb.Bin520]HOU32329.1 S-adenosyl-l-methionine hydroxide adenosyltransferase family protein [Synergistaceae bacterium]HQF90865.1 S-adenosyl-l-methionine hydroxide adenosyltransferase family protein [Synergistaceae bacterium]HQH78008.1 S-adenosyl-l-methionine hydroxide adenosyltransferase family protein [Synergistaceae bacterium]HQK25741.1 S-adenosyl-l-methionine hydroxide adenosyltransferase family protein [Synergistaceae bacterium]